MSKTSNQLKSAVYQAWQQIAGEHDLDPGQIRMDDFSLEHPSDEKFGDFTTNLAMVAFKQGPALFKSPLALAEKIITQLKDNETVKKWVNEVQAVKPGFINLSIKTNYYVTQLQELLKQGNKYGTSDLMKSKKIMVEFAHPNTHKAFHIGHLRNISTGESLVRLLEANGAKVIRSNYQGDVGMHIAKCLWGILQIKNYQKQMAGLKTLTAKVKFISDAYVAGTRAYEDSTQAKEEIKDINYLIYAAAQQYQQKEHSIKPGSTDYLRFVDNQKNRLHTIYDLWLQTRQWSLEQFEHIYRRVYTHFDRLYFESECLAGVDEAKQALKKGILTKSRGAIVFDGTKYGLDTRVFINSLGLPTYEGKELGLAPKELSEFGQLDRIIHVVTPEQTSFFRVTFKVEELLGWQKDQQYHLAYEWVKLKQGKMSSRVGNIILGEWLLDEVKAKLRQNFSQLDEDTAEMVAVGAVKYSMLKQSVYTQIKFDIDESVSIQGNSGPYLQYTYARCRSVLRKANQDSFELQATDFEFNQEELSLLRWLSRYGETVMEAGTAYAPNLICTYLYELAQRYNGFYNRHTILGSKTNHSHQTELRLALTQATALILKTGLKLLGIKAPEKM